MCTNIFINKGGYHVEARSMDFPINMGTTFVMGFVGQKSTTNPVVDADKIPAAQLTSWSNKYGYVGRAGFDTPVVIDGMNTQGLSISILYLPGSQYPQFNPSDKRPALSCIELGTYFLSQAKTVEEAYQLMQSHQLVDWAIEAKPGLFIKSIPLHYSVRDKTGDSMVIEFINGEAKVYRPSGSVLTNAPSFDWQLEYAKHYSSLNVSDEKPNEAMAQYVYKYNEIYPTALRPAVNNLMGIPGDYSPSSRFAKCTVLLNNLYAPNSSAEAVYQASMILNTAVVPYMPGTSPKTKITTTTLWSTIKDLDNLVIRYLEQAYMQADQKILPMSVDAGYKPLDLKSINFDAIPAEFEGKTIQPNTRKDIQVLDVTQVPGF
jgi:choloylglycine hydrolase